MKAVRFDEYGPVAVLDVRDVPIPEAGPGQVLIRVKAAGINPGEAKIREGALHERWPATFPSGQGSDFAGVVERLGAGVTAVAERDEVIGWVDTRSSQAEYVVADQDDLAPRPSGLPWEVAGAIPVAGFTAWAMVRAVDVKPGDTVVVSGAAGGVGSLAVQLARRAGATVIGLAGPSNHDWLKRHDVIPVAYGDGVADRIRNAGPAPGRRVPRHLRRRLRGDRTERPRRAPGADRLGRPVRRRGQVRHQGRRQRARARAPPPSRSWPGLIAAKEIELPIARTLPAGGGRHRLHPARQGAHPRQDRADPVVCPAG